MEVSFIMQKSFNSELLFLNKIPLSNSHRVKLACQLIQ